ncbi:hypothetical protein PG990_006185 [Apiospora arundinis]|uniref:Uncharacterized protein n=1 Tax=Apiospora arundinis TaxID=335852 RepID=A0ABR2J9S5_9PEZI
MKHRQRSLPVLGYAAAVFVAASTTVHASTAAPDGQLETAGNKTGTTNSSTPKDVVHLSPLTPTTISSPIHESPSPHTPVGRLPQAHHAHLEASQGAYMEPATDESADDDMWENESGIVYGGFGWRHDKRGSEGGPGAVIVAAPPYLYGGHYPKSSSGTGRPRPFGFLRG